MIKNILKFFGFHKPKITVEYGENNKDEQIQEVKIYRDGEYSHTVNMHYFTEKQFDELQKEIDE